MFFTFHDVNLGSDFYPFWENLTCTLAENDDVTTAKNQEQNQDFNENEPIVSRSIQKIWLEQPIPDKLFFLATGEGCGTVEVCFFYLAPQGADVDLTLKELFTILKF